MPLREIEERLVALAMRQIALQDALDRARRVLGLHVLVDVAREPCFGAEAAADQHVIAVDRVAFLVDRNARRDQPDVADVVLRAGVMAAGEMDVHRRVERDARLAPRGDLLGLLLGVRGREAAAGRAGAGDEPGADRSRLRGQPERLDRGFGERDLVVRHAGDQQVLPDREADIAVAQVVRDLREAAHLRDGDLADRKDDADPVQPRLLLRAHADMRRAIERRAAASRPRRARGSASSRASPRRRRGISRSPRHRAHT